MGEGMLEECHIVYPYQLELSVLLSDCFRMSFQSGEVFCNSQAMGGFPYQDIESQMLELEFRVYHRM